MVWWHGWTVLDSRPAVRPLLLRRNSSDSMERLTAFVLGAPTSDTMVPPDARDFTVRASLPDLVKKGLDHTGKLGRESSSASP